ncbi:MAG: hypothetical protein RJA98_1906 [Pseudomonadota bacterium]|jgi:hypothetical protein
MRNASFSLGEMADLLPGFAFRGAIQDEHPGDVHVVSMANTPDDVLTEGTPLPAITFLGDQAKLRVLPGDLLFRARGVSNQAVLVQSIKQPTILAAPLIRIRVHAHLLDPHYLHWMLNSSPVQRDINAIARGTMVRMVTVTSLRELKIPAPPLAVQRQIADIAALQREEQHLSAALIKERQHHVEQVLWAKAQEVR